MARIKLLDYLKSTEGRGKQLSRGHDIKPFKTNKHVWDGEKRHFNKVIEK